MKWHIFKFRPSSHSEDYTIIATFNDEKTAEKVEGALLRMLEDMRNNLEDYDVDWSPDEAHVTTNGNQVIFEVYTAGYLDDVESLIRKIAKPLCVECYQDYQEIVICVKVPKGLSPEMALLVLDKDEAEAIKWLMKTCGEPKIVEAGKHWIFKWLYSGDGIYYERTLHLGDIRIDLNEHKNWEVMD